MRTLSTENAAALAARQLVARDFLWIIARDYDTGGDVPHGFWSDVGDVSAPVLDPNTGLSDTRSFEGSGTLIQIGAVPLVSNLTVQNITISLSQIDESVANFARGYDLKQARVEVYRGLFSPASRRLVAPAVNRFVGFVDQVEITTPKEGEAGAIVLTCASNTQEVTRSNPDTRSYDSQVLRSETDNFFQDVTTVAGWEFFWGGKTGKVDAVGPKRIGITVRADNQ
ncbi:hypothetical protein LB579_31155 [Mesorhizobium sp. BR1-1-7]|uniref:hypothetical protein n=1 Tax=Mesorhizobium sp. BR1-1-7 TaxID=2876647 RepID=UPI001CCE1298|nr:hypothetical protein [Mesorhizobium sp. BR1-1-7]MBZ9922144.1 hypothetical protein [Mesorhizobium sp. BR1-1-7]